ncbi:MULTISPECIES: alpha/beta hydrolase [unclassified Aminobacter]|uniref:alpha/beta hydrolase n=1 Tax=unclassified Aminobacter TaxID=2644704 RepID=UPI0004665106|nr:MULTISPECIES: alpha/beta hydrolase [unclassified Aminobacter]TWG65557.1 acetyl esterase/lipase [Aminobacter sp. J44]TWH36267.1 acetyl esterase/lipase [Aminobacter sp. J15]
MIFHRITDWDDAYANAPNIPRGEEWPQRWADLSGPFRTKMEEAGRAKLALSYGERPRNLFDLFLPEGAPKGLVIFIHGGFWMKLDGTIFSHLAEGPMAHGFAVAVPSYTLCPDIRISGIVKEIGAAVEAAAALVEGPIYLTGHSAGGHLATRMICTNSPLGEETRARIADVVSISGVHDLRPLLNTKMNASLHLDAAEARAESPVLLEPVSGAKLCCWVGAGERSEFIRQNALLANVWTGLGATAMTVEEPDRHHFNVVDGLADPEHALTRTLLMG